MSDNILRQAYVFGITIACGCFISLLYDVIRIFRRIIKHSLIFIAIEDVIFWITSSLILFSVLYSQNDGIIRGFAIIGVVIGMVLYYIILSNLIVNLTSKLINNMIKLIQNIIILILKPIIKLFKLIVSPFKWIYRIINRYSTYSLKRLKKNLKKIKIVYKKV